MSFVKLPLVILCLVHSTLGARTGIEQSAQIRRTGNPLTAAQVIERLAGVRSAYRTKSNEKSGQCVNSQEGAVTAAEVSAVFAGSTILPPDKTKRWQPPPGLNQTSYEGKFELSPAAQAMHDAFSKMADEGKITRQTVYHGTKGPSPKFTMNPTKLLGLKKSKSPVVKMNRVLGSIASSGFRYAGRTAYGSGIYTGAKNTAYGYATHESGKVCGAVIEMELFGGTLTSDNDTQVASYSQCDPRNGTMNGCLEDWKIVCEPILLFPVSYAIVGTAWWDDAPIVCAKLSTMS